MEKTYLITGSNEGEPARNLQNAALLIETECGRIARRSSLYQTAAWGKTDQPDFLNQVLEIETNLAPEILIQTLLDIELKMGRQRKIKYGPRLIDIDILLYGDLVINQPQLKIPHPHLHQRRFVLEPLNELAPGVVHPVFNKTIGQLLEECADPLAVKKL